MNSTTTKPATPHYKDPKATYSFDVEVIDLRTNQRTQIYIDANTKASAGKKARDFGYLVCSMSFV